MRNGSRILAIIEVMMMDRKRAGDSGTISTCAFDDDGADKCLILPSQMSCRWLWPEAAEEAEDCWAVGAIGAWCNDKTISSSQASSFHRSKATVIALKKSGQSGVLSVRVVQACQSVSVSDWLIVVLRTAPFAVAFCVAEPVWKWPNEVSLLSPDLSLTRSTWPSVSLRSHNCSRHWLSLPVLCPNQLI